MCGRRGTSQKHSSRRAGLLPSPCPPQPGREHSLRAPHPPDPWAECSQALPSCLGFTLDPAGSVSQRPGPILPPRGAGAVQSHPLGSVCLWCRAALHKRSFVPSPRRDFVEGLCWALPPGGSSVLKLHLFLSCRWLLPLGAHLGLPPFPSQPFGETKSLGLCHQRI